MPVVFVSAVSSASLLRGSDLAGLDLVEQIQGLYCKTRVPTGITPEVSFGNGCIEAELVVLTEVVDVFCECLE